MPKEEDDPISRLLRLKRYEQPRPGYFDDFLQEFQRRQRAELLRRPLWRLALDRVQAFWAELKAPQLAYATASVAVVGIATVFTVNMLQAPLENAGPTLAAAYPHATTQGTMRNLPMVPPAPGGSPTSPAQLASGPLTTQRTLSIDGPRFQEQEPATTTPWSNPAVYHQPRYILDSRPTSYEAPFDF